MFILQNYNSTHRNRLKLFLFCCPLLFCIFFFNAGAARAQTTTFTYQGRFTDSTAAQPTSGTYEMQFKAFDAASAGNQLDATITNPTVQVVNGIFTVQLDYGAATFGGAEVFLEIAVRPSGSQNAYTVLAPRQRFTSAPLAIQSLKAAQADDAAKLGNVPANQYVQTNDSRLTDSRNPLAGSANYIQNQTSVSQATSNFNVSGGGTLGGTLSANIVNSQTNFRIGGATVFSTPNSSSVVAGRSANHTLLAPNSTFFGYNAGAVTTLFGQSGTFIGSKAGAGNTSGADNSFVGKHAGIFSSTGSSNSFFGSNAGKFNNASENSYFGAESGFLGLNGTSNSFFGFQTGRANLSGDNNSFFGYQAGKMTTGDGNTFVGSGAGLFNTTGSNNTILGSQTNSSGNGNTTIGVGAGGAGNWNTSIGGGAGGGGNYNTAVGYGASVQKFSAASPYPINATAIGAGAVVNLDNTIVLGTTNDFVRVPGGLNVAANIFGNNVNANSMNTSQIVITGGSVKLTTLPFSTNTGNQSLCLNGNNFISKCPSNFADNSPVLTRERNARIEAQAAQIKEQNARIAVQTEQIKIQQTNLEALRQTICEMNPAANICGK